MQQQSCLLILLKIKKIFTSPTHIVFNLKQIYLQTDNLNSVWVMLLNLITLDISHEFMSSINAINRYYLNKPWYEMAELMKTDIKLQSFSELCGR